MVKDRQLFTALLYFYFFFFFTRQSSLMAMNADELFWRLLVVDFKSAHTHSKEKVRNKTITGAATFLAFWHRQTVFGFATVYKCLVQCVVLCCCTATTAKPTTELINGVEAGVKWYSRVVHWHFVTHKHFVRLH